MVAAGPRSDHPAELLAAVGTDAPGGVALNALALTAARAGTDGLLVVPAAAETADGGYAQASAGSVGPVLAIGVGGGGGDSLLVGDLDGDGGDDVVTTQYGTDGITLTALRGTDGRRLWLAPQDDEVAGSFLQAVPDVDGDSRRDILATGVTYTGGSGSGDCDESSCTDEYSESLTWTITMLSGATGTELWRDTVDGHTRQRYFYDFDTGEESYEFETSNYPVAFHPAGDLDGDTHLDLLSARSTVTESYSRETTGTAPGPTQTTETSSVQGSSTLLLIDGADGSTIREHVETDTDGVLGGIPVPDTNADDISDVLATRYHGADGTRSCTQLLIQLTCDEAMTLPSTDVVLLSGADLSTIWTHDVPAAAVFAQAPGDLTDDGAVDVVVSTFYADRGTTGQPPIQVLDGTDGTEMWRVGAEESSEEEGTAQFLDIRTVVAATPLDDEPGKDLLLRQTGYSYNFDTGEESSSTTIERRNGATGALLLSTSTTSEGGFATVSVRPVEADGDGSADLLMESFSLDYDTGEQDQTFRVESGKTGDELMAKAFDGFATVTVLGDVDDDGGDDAVITDLGDIFFGFFGDEASSGEASDDEAPDPVMSVFGLDDGEEIWQRPLTDGALTLPRGAGDLDGLDDGVDVLIEGVAFFGDVGVSLTAARAGSDGHLLWSDPEPVPVRRVAGTSRVATAAALSADTRETADTVLIARADAWPDAVAGGPLAAMLEGSLLLSAHDGLSPETAAEIQRLGASHAILLGGDAALSPTVASDLATLGLNVERLAGTDRFTTAAMIADRVGAAGGDVTEVAVVRGVHPDPNEGWTDAVVAAAYGAADGHPILLTAPEAVPAQTIQALQNLGATDALVLGGPASVSVDAVNQIRDAGVSAFRVAGFDRYSTARVTAEIAVEEGVDPSTVWVATGLRFPDALAASAAAGTGGVVLLTPGHETDRGDHVLGFVALNRDDVDEVVLIGGSAALSDPLESRLRGLLEG